MIGNKKLFNIITTNELKATTLLFQIVSSGGRLREHVLVSEQL